MKNVVKKFGMLITSMLFKNWPHCNLSSSTCGLQLTSISLSEKMGMLERLDINLNLIYHLLCCFWNIGSHNYQTTIPFSIYSYIIWQYWRLRDDSHKCRNKTNSSATQETFSHQSCLLIRQNSPITFALVTKRAKRDKKAWTRRKFCLDHSKCKYSHVTFTSCINYAYWPLLNIIDTIMVSGLNIPSYL